MTSFKGCSSLLAVLAASGLCVAQELPHVMVAPVDVKWGPASPKLPPGAQFALLVGDPSKPGAPYVFRARLPDGYSVPPHWHPMDENVTVITGTFMLGFGERIDKSSMRSLPAGAYAMLPRRMPHYNMVKGETILQFHGIGPYDIQYVNPADDPTRSPRPQAAGGRGRGFGRLTWAPGTSEVASMHAWHMRFFSAASTSGRPGIWWSGKRHSGRGAGTSSNSQLPTSNYQGH